MKIIAAALLCVGLSAFAQLPAALADSATTQPVAGVHGGLALVVGSSDPTIATNLAARGSFFVQVLQPDAKLSGEWGEQFASSQNKDREKLAVRNAAFDPEHYGTNLFNLILVVDAAALGKAKLADLDRILVPQGVVAFMADLGGIADQAKTLGMVAVPDASFAAVFAKPVRPFEWKVCDSIRWRAGPRGANASAFTGLAIGDGKLFYRERMELDRGNWPKSRSQLVVRDAYNGRVLWSVEEAPGWDPGWGTRSRSQTGMACDDGGRLFVTTDEGKFVCVDADTGRAKFTMGDSKGVRDVRIVGNLVIAGGRVFSADNGKLLWSFQGIGYAIDGDLLLVRAGRGEAVEAHNLADGKLLWKQPCAAGWGTSMISSPGRLHLLQARPKSIITTLDTKTGQQAWVREFDPGKYGQINLAVSGGKLFAYYSQKGVKQDYFFVRMAPDSGQIEQEGFGAPGKMWAGGCWDPFVVGDFLVYHHNIWLNLKTLERVFPYLAHPACFRGSLPAMGMLYNFPSRKGGVLEGITAIGPADIEFDHEPAGKVLVKLGEPPADATSTQPAEWPMFRAGPTRGNHAATADPGDRPAKRWDVKIGIGNATYGQMSGQRTGLTQPVIGYGLVVVADIPAQRIVAVSADDGQIKWTYHVGSRVDFSPTLYNGLCIFGARNGWVYCLDARTGKPLWRLLAAPRERYVGGHEAIESLWPMAADVLVADGVGYVSVGVGTSLLGGIRVTAFKPESGQVVWAKCFHGQLSEIQDRQGWPGIITTAGGKSPLRCGTLTLDPATGAETRGGAVAACLAPKAIDDYLGYGNSICRTNEDRAHDTLSDGRLSGRALAFSPDIAVAYTTSWGGESWDARTNKGIPISLNLTAAREPKKPLWKSPDIELVVDDIVLTPKRAYCIGHYQRVDKDPELWVVSPEDGKVVNTIPIDAFPSFLGMAAAGDRLYFSTRDGRLICLSPAKEK